MDDKNSSVYPKGSVMRKKLKDWGALRVSRDLISFINIILRENEIPPDNIDSFLHPIVVGALARMRKDKQERLSPKYAIDAFKNHSPNLLEINFFQEEAFRDNIARGFRCILNEDTYQTTDMNITGLLYLIPDLFSRKEKDALMEYYIELLPVPQIKEKLSKLRKKGKKLEENSDEWKENINKRLIVEACLRVYFETYEFLLKAGNKKQREQLHKKLKVFRSLQPEDSDSNFKKYNL